LYKNTVYCSAVPSPSQTEAATATSRSRSPAGTLGATATDRPRSPAQSPAPTAPRSLPLQTRAPRTVNRGVRLRN
jgi:hypothetical protein